MARQTPTQAELDAVFDNDFQTFILPIDASLDLESRTVYGTTDPTLGLSMVNVRHLNNTRFFKGTWVLNPLDGTLDDDGLNYKEGEVVIGSDQHLYQRGPLDLTNNPDPVMDQQTPANARSWTQLSVDTQIFSVDNEAATASNPTINVSRGVPGDEEAVATFRSNNMSITNTTGNEILFDATSPPTLVSDPMRVELPAFRGGVSAATLFNVTPSTGTFSGTPTVTQASTIGTMLPALGGLNVTPDGAVAANLTNVVTPGAGYEVTVSAPVEDAEIAGFIHPAIMGTTEVVYSDMRMPPTVSDSLSVPSIGTQDTTFEIALAQPGTSTILGTAYDFLGYVVTLNGNADPVRPASGIYQLPSAINTDAQLSFTFPFDSVSPLNGQRMPTREQIVSITQNRTVTVYDPWFVGTSATQPDASSVNTTSFPVSDAAFPMQGEAFTHSVTGTANENIYLIVPTNIIAGRNFMLEVGIARTPGIMIGSFDVTDATGGSSINYTSYLFGGLYSSPTTFTISS